MTVWGMEKELAAAEVIRQHFAENGGGDEEALVDTIEGQTNLLEKIDTILARRAEAEANSEAAAKQIANLKSRQDRFDKEEERYRDMLFGVLKALDIKNLNRPQALLTRCNRPSKPIIIDEASIPAEYMKTKTETKPIIGDIKKALEANKLVPGAILSNGDESLQIKQT